MAILTQTNSQLDVLVQRAAYAFAQLKDQRTKKRLYRQTYRELNNLSGRELADLGINRTMIKGIAYEAAFGK
jgi:uncharacterized protein YjiS (DUF1127 family)